MADALLTVTFRFDAGDMGRRLYEACGRLTEPLRGSYPTHEAYVLAWNTWRAQQRDGLLTADESAAKLVVTEQHVRARSGRTVR